LADSLVKRPKDLTDGREVADLTDGEIFWTITKGRDPMPAFDQKLTDAERWGLVHLLRSMSRTKPNTIPRHP
jgi:mono/diheme cytochrome c family protein